MAFLSAPFFIFCLVTIAIFLLLPRRGRAPWLLAASWFFYLCTDVRFFPFLLFAVVVSYVAGRLLERGRRRGVVAVTVLLCMGLLFLLKYLNFALGLLSSGLKAAGVQFSSPALKLLLPAGISFYLFQAVGYVVDVYRGRQSARHSFLLHALFLSFFPQLLSGPIARAPQLLPQLEALSGPSWDEFRGGLFRFLWGAFKKLVIADRLALLVTPVFAAPGSYGRWQLILAAVAFSLQIYCDFSAYSDMAVGVAHTLGITLTENFRAPYLARSVQDFWRRWHISLSSWFRDYLYIPLGGSRSGPWRKRLNLMIVFAVSGLWHGAALTFLVWGLLNGLYLVVGDLTGPARRRLHSALRLPEDSPRLILPQMALSFVLAMVAWVFFQSPSLSSAGLYFRQIFTGPAWISGAAGLPGRPDLAVAAAALTVLLLADCADCRRPLTQRWLAAGTPVRWLSALALLLATAVLGCYGPGYHAQDFIYFQF